MDQPKTIRSFSKKIAQDLSRGRCTRDRVHDKRVVKNKIGGSPLRPFPTTVTRAIIQASEWLKSQEYWVVRGQVADLGDRLQSATSLAHQIGSGTRTGQIPPGMRRDLLFILAYLPADIRIGFLISMSERDPDALEALLKAPYDAKAEPALHNIVSTIGGLARHGLLSDIFTRERMDLVERIVRDVGRVRNQIMKGSV